MPVIRTLLNIPLRYFYRPWRTLSILGLSIEMTFTGIQSQEGTAMAVNYQDRTFPTSAGILLGLGLGGFFDGIIFHQILQWHHMLSNAGYPVTSIDNLKVNTLWDGLFHASTYLLVVGGLIQLWKNAHRAHLWWSTRLLAGSILIGFGIFNVVEGLIDHHLLAIHHVNETVPRSEWIYWDLGFLAWGAAMLAGGWNLYKSGRQASPGGAAS
jgi:uncharacterized membrane protein